MSAWIDIVNRSSDPISGYLAKLMQRQARSDAQSNKVTDDNLKQLHRTFYDSLSLIDDPYFNASIRNKTAHAFKLPIEPDHDKLRAWFKFDTGGRALIDYSYFDNHCLIVTTKETPKLYRGLDDGITGGHLVSYINGMDQFFQVTDNSNIKISGFSTSTYVGFSISCSIQAYRLAVSNGRNTTIFYKTDDNNIDNAYTAQIDSNGNVLVWFKYAGTVYSAWASAIIPIISLPPFIYQNYMYQNFLTDYNFQIDSNALIDLVFTFNFSTHAIKIYKGDINGNSVDVTSGISLPSGATPNFPPAYIDPGPPPTNDPFVDLYNVPQTSTTDYVYLSSGAGGALTPVYNVGIPAGGSGSFTDVYNVTGSNSYYTLDGTRTRAGEIAGTSGSSLIGKVITKVIVTLKKTGSPSGTITVTVRRNSDDAIMTTLGTMSASSVTTSDASYTFTNTAATYSMVQGDKILVEYSGTSTNYIQVKRTGSDSTGAPFDLLASYGVSYDPTGPQYLNNTDRDIEGTFSTGGSTSLSYSDLNDQRQRQAIYLATSSSALIGKKITSAVFYLHKTGTPTGTLSVVIRDSSGALLVTLGTLDVSTLTGSDASYSFTNLNANRILATNDYISIEYSAGTATNYVSINRDDDVYDGANTYIRNYDGIQWRNVTTKDMCGILYIGGTPNTNGRTRVGIEVDTNSVVMKNNIVTKCMFTMKKIGSPAGTLAVTIRRPNDTIAITIGTLSVSTLTTSNAVKTFTNISNTYNMEVGSKVSIEYTGGDTNNKVAILQTDNINTETFSFDFDDVIYRDYTSKDIVAQIQKGGGPYSGPPPVGSQPIEDYNHDLYIGVGRAFNSGFANIVLADFRIYRLIMSLTQAQNLHTNKFSISNLTNGNVAVLGFQALST